MYITPLALHLLNLILTFEVTMPGAVIRTLKAERILLFFFFFLPSPPPGIARFLNICLLSRASWKPFFLPQPATVLLVHEDPKL